ncbi:MAG: heavy metal translocating P-type ATPase [Coriobacteriia bacterium]
MSAERATAVVETATLGSGLRCAECDQRVCEQLRKLNGVVRVDCAATGTMRVDFDPFEVSEAQLRSEAERYGVEVIGTYSHAAWRVLDLDCPDCAQTVAKSVRMLPGVLSADLNFASATLLVEYSPDGDPRPAVVAAVARAGHGVEPLLGAEETAAAEGASAAGAGLSLLTRLRTRRTQVAVIGSGAFGLLGWALHLTFPGSFAEVTAGHVAVVVAYLLSVAFGWFLLLPRAIAAVRARRIDMNVLMIVAVAGAVALGDFSEAAAVVFLFALGGWLEARALDRTRNSIRDLMRLAPSTARVLRGASAVEIPIAEIRPGDLLLVRPGERVAVDAVVEEGDSAVDESPITGEPIPVEKREGDVLYAGSLNTTGLLQARVTSSADDSTLARVVRLVEEAQSAKAPAELIVDRFSRYYTPAVVMLAALVWIVPSLWQGGLGDWSVWLRWLPRALVVLVAACPCALVISTPVTFVSAIARASRDGILVKGGAFFEVGARVRAIAFDKTGTLTEGRPKVTQAESLDGADPLALVAIAASLEAHSTHPLARAVQEDAEQRGLTLEAVTGFRELPGRGVEGLLGGKRYALVSLRFAEEIAEIGPRARAAISAAEDEGLTVLVLLEERRVLGFLGVSDPIREEVPSTVSALRDGGIEHLTMLTGDNERTAAGVAAKAGLSGHMAQLLPEEKVASVVRLGERYGTVAMVGDGINDAPALAQADVGIAMGAAGSDIALETADVALMADGVSALPGFFALARRTIATIRFNVGFSVIVKLAVLVGAVLGYANMWLAVFADTGVALLVILNGLRLFAVRTKAQ